MQVEWLAELPLLTHLNLKHNAVQARLALLNRTQLELNARGWTHQLPTARNECVQHPLRAVQRSLLLVKFSNRSVTAT